MSLTLDIGCGWRKRGNIGIDYTKNPYGKKGCLDVLADMEYLPFQDNMFEKVVSWNSRNIWSKVFQDFFKEIHVSLVNIYLFKLIHEIVLRWNKHLNLVSVFSIYFGSDMNKYMYA